MANIIYIIMQQLQLEKQSWSYKIERKFIEICKCQFIAVHGMTRPV